MLIRISLIIAIVAGLAAAAVSFTQVKGKIETVKQQRDFEKGEKETAQRDLASTKSDLAKTEKELKDTKTELTGAQEERDKAVAEAASQVKRANQLKTDLDKTRTERDNAQAELSAWAALGIPVDQVKQVIAQAKQLGEEREVLLAEKKVLMRDNERWKDKYYSLVKEDYQITLPAKLRGAVTVCDPKWEFVVLNVGEEEGVREKGQLLVSRNGKLVAKVMVLTVHKGRSIANVMSGWKLDDVAEGDLVIPAYPAS